MIATAADDTTAPAGGSALDKSGPDRPVVNSTVSVPSTRRWWTPRLIWTRWPGRRVVAIGLATLVCLIGGFAFGRLTAASPVDGSASPSAITVGTPAAPGAHEQRLQAVNTAKIPAGQLRTFAAPWLGAATNCQAATESEGPRLGDGETTRVRCRVGLAALYLVAYRSPADHDRARTRYLAQAVDARRLAPQVALPTRRATTSGTSTGNYIEYAYAIPGGDRAGQVVAGIWWDSDTAAVAGYLVSYWADELGSRWEPLRELWQRSS